MENMKNKNTTKTESSLRQFQYRLAEPPRNDNRSIWQIMPAELDNFIGSFLLSIRKAGGSEYEPDTLTSYHQGLDRCLRENKYPYSLVKDKEFETSRAVLGSKRKELKQKGKGNKPNATEPISNSEQAILREKGLLETDSPDRLLNTVWLNNTVLYGIRSGTENRNLRWGDIKLKKTDAGREYIEYSERLTKTRTAERKTETRAFPSKQFGHENKDTCPVHAFKEYARHRPASMLEHESPFYLSINHQRRPSSETWYKTQSMGENFLGSLVKKRAEKGGLQGRKTNHSARKTTCTKLLHNGIAPTTIQQLTGHKNVQSVNNYATASLEMQEELSDILSDNPNRQNTNLQVKNNTPTLTVQHSSNIHTLSRPTSFQNHNHMSEINSTNTYQFSGQVLQSARLMNCSITVNNFEGRLPVQKKAS